LSCATQVRDGAAVMTCLKRALKVANAAQQQLAMSAKRTGLSEPVRLYVDILNQYLFFFDQGVTNITVTVLQVRSENKWISHEDRHPDFKDENHIVRQIVDCQFSRSPL